MKTSRFTDSQIMQILKQAEAGSPAPELCREHGMSTATFYKWRAKFGGMDASLMTRMKELEDENRRLKKMYAEERLKAEIVTEALSKNGCAIRAKNDGAVVRGKQIGHDSRGMPGVWHQPDLLPILCQIVIHERTHRRLAGVPDDQPAQLGIRLVLPASTQRQRLSMEPSTRLSDLPGTGTESAHQTAPAARARGAAGVGSASQH